MFLPRPKAVTVLLTVTFFLLGSIGFLVQHYHAQDANLPELGKALAVDQVTSAETEPSAVQDPWPGAKTISANDTVSKDGRELERVRLVETSLPWGRLRVEETWEIDPLTGKPAKLRRQIAMVAGHVMARLRKDVSEDAFNTFLQANGLSITRRHPASRVYLIRIGPREQVDFLGVSERYAYMLFPVFFSYRAIYSGH